MQKIIKKTKFGTFPRIPSALKNNFSTEKKGSAQNGDITDRARVVIIGGGVIGTSVAYHLAKLGWSKEGILLLEQEKLTSGTTWHAAGLVETFGSFSETSTEFRKYTRELYATLEQETGLSTGWRQCGFIELAATRDYYQQFQRIAAFNRRHGVEVEEISAAEVKILFPLCNTEDLFAGFYVPKDGRANPVDCTMSLAKGARMGGAKLLEGVRVKEVVSRKGKVEGVMLEDGRLVECEYVVNCAGMWARQLGAKNGVIIPNQAAEHYYLITEKIAEVDPSWPVIEDPSSFSYVRPEGDGLMIGLFEPHAAAWSVREVPPNFSFGSLPPDWERMTPFLDKGSF